MEIDLPDDELEISQNIQEVVDQVEGESSNKVTRDESTETNTGLRRSNRERHQPDYYGVWVNSTQTKEQYDEPRTFEEASMCPERDKWMEAMEREMASLKANDVCDLVELPKDRKVVGSKWYTNEKSSLMDQLRDLSQD